jgi:ribose/xylose/arabinose/galactoside ABC-type transport system permease subunit
MVIVQQVSVNGIVALGVTIIIMIGGMDLSVGSILTLCGVCAGMMDNAGFPLWLTIVLAIVVGVTAGIINGVLITTLRIPDIIVTLATMNIYRGLAVIITGSKWVTGFTPAFLEIGSTKNGFLCVPVLIFGATIVVFAFMLRMTPFGRVLYALGGNRQAALLMGLNVKGIRVKVYAVGGLLLAFAGLILTSMIGNIQAMAQSSPGAIGVNMSAQVGFQCAGIPGALTAAAGLAAPSIIVITIIARMLAAFKGNRMVTAVFSGLRPAATGLLAAVGFGVIKLALYNAAAPVWYELLKRRETLLFGALLLLVYRFKKNPIVYIAAGGAAGIALGL